MNVNSVPFTFGSCACLPCPPAPSTKVKNIRLIEGDHDIDCRIEGFGAMQLKSEHVKKA